MIDHQHVSLFGEVSCRCTDQEAKNLALITAYRQAKHSERGQFLAPDFKRHRAGFTHIGEIFSGHGMNDEAVADRRNVVLELTAKGDKVWGIWRVTGTHTGSIYGIPATGRPIDVIEVGLWRVQDDLIAEAWYFGDELGLLRQLDLYPAS